MKLNCWEFTKCGRQPGGEKVFELGVCPAATDATHDGKNGGENSGRFCWKVTGTLCGGGVQRNFASKFLDCTQCEFFNLVRDEEGDNFII